MMLRFRTLPVLLCLLLQVPLRPAVGADGPAVYPELVNPPFLFEVVRHLYRWYLDEEDVESLTGSESFLFWVRNNTHGLDPGDQSRFGEILLPQLNTHVQVKQSHYTIEEMDLTVTNDAFKIIHVGRRPVSTRPEGFQEVRVDYGQMRDYLFRTRKQAEFPQEDLLLRLRLAVREELLEEVQAGQQERPRGEQTIFQSPLSPVANEIWVYWENGRLLIRFASDIDLANPAVWEHDELSVDMFDVDEQVVVSLDEVGGSNAYLTRDQVGRALFNCIVLGRRLDILPLDQDQAPSSDE